MKLEETKSIYIYISMHLYINIAIYIYLSLYIYLYLYIYLSIFHYIYIFARWRSFVCSRQGTAGPGAAGFRYASGRLRPACGVIPYSFS